MKSKLSLGFILGSLMICLSAQAGEGWRYTMLCNRTGYTGEYWHQITIGKDDYGQCKIFDFVTRDNKTYERIDNLICVGKDYKFTAYRNDGYSSTVQIHLFGNGDLGTALWRDKNNHVGTCLLKDKTHMTIQWFPQ